MTQVSKARRGGLLNKLREIQCQTGVAWVGIDAVLAIGQGRGGKIDFCCASPKPQHIITTAASHCRVTRFLSVSASASIIDI